MNCRSRCSDDRSGLTRARLACAFAGPEIFSTSHPQAASIELYINARPLRLLHSPHRQLAELETQISPRRLAFHHACHCCIAPVRPADLQPVPRHRQHAAGRAVALQCLAALPVRPAFLECSLRHGGSPCRITGCCGAWVGHAWFMSDFVGGIASYSRVRFTPESGHVRCKWGCPLCANSGHCAALSFANLTE